MPPRRSSRSMPSKPPPPKPPPPKPPSPKPPPTSPPSQVVRALRPARPPAPNPPADAAAPPGRAGPATGPSSGSAGPGADALLPVLGNPPEVLAEAVVPLAEFRVGQGRVGLVDLLEAFLGARVLVHVG